MKPTDQTKFGYPHGNCFDACVASIFEIPLEAFPTLPVDDAECNRLWWDIWFAWLVEKNAGLVQCPSGGELHPWKPHGYVIAGGKSPRGDFDHAVVALNGEIIHDPHPSRAGLDGPVKDWTIIYPLDPSKPLLLGVGTRLQK